MEGFEDLCLIDTEEETTHKQKRKEDETYIPLRREPFGFLTDDISKATVPVRSNAVTAQVMYLYAMRDYQKAMNLSLSFLANPENEKCGKSLLNQYHDILMRCHLEMDQFDKAKDYADKLIESCGHQDTDCWMISAIVGFLSGDLKEGFKSLEMMTAMRNSNPNVWLLYATVLSHLYSTTSGDAATVSEKLKKCNISRHFHKRFSDILKLPPQQKPGLPANLAYFYTICAVHNASTLASNIYLQQNSKHYAEFSTWNSDHYDILKGIIDEAEPDFKPYLEKNCNIIHYQNWDDINMSDIDLEESFLKFNPYSGLEN